jgi:ubiquinone/menaquinone biosynthesis C-methylase UbiE
MNKKSPFKNVAKKLTAKRPQLKATSETSWGSVASWYDKHLEHGADTYHEKVVYPNVMRLLGDVKDKHVLDLACGQGQFSRKLAEASAKVIGIDVGKELIAIAEKNNEDYKFTNHYFVSPSHDLYMIKDGTQDLGICILALQNIEELQKTIQEVSRVLKPKGRFVCVINHPSFRNPRHTHWGYDEHAMVQYRRVDEYLSESKIKIDMTPGRLTDKKFTISFHRPLQVYMKAFAKCGLVVTRLEEWESHKKSERGPRQEAEDAARKEIPLFMCLEVLKPNH